MSYNFPLRTVGLQLLENGTRKVQKTNLGLDMNQVLVYMDDINLMGDDIKKRERDADMLLNAYKDIGLLLRSTLYNADNFLLVY